MRPLGPGLGHDFSPQFSQIGAKPIMTLFSNNDDNKASRRGFITNILIICKWVLCIVKAHVGDGSLAYGLFHFSCDYIYVSLEHGSFFYAT